MRVKKIKYINKTIKKALISLFTILFFLASSLTYADLCSRQCEHKKTTVSSAHDCCPKTKWQPIENQKQDQNCESHCMFTAAFEVIFKATAPESIEKHNYCNTPLDLEESFHLLDLQKQSFTPIPNYWDRRFAKIPIYIYLNQLLIAFNA